MKDVENFCKLFKVPCPVEKLFDHYVEVLIRAGDDKLQGYLDLYNERESEVDNMYLDKKGYFISIQEALEATTAHLLFNAYSFEHNAELHPDRTVTKLKESIKSCSDGKHLFISLDMVSANYQTLKMFDHKGELHDTWEEFLRSHEVPEVYVVSKSFRQYVFEQANPKRTHRFQKNTMSKVLHTIDNLYGDKSLVDDFLVFQSHDEVIFAIPYAHEKFNEMVNLLTNITPHTQKYFSIQLKLRVSYFTNKVLDGDKMLRTMLNEKGEVIKRILKYVPANVFYKYLRKYVLQEKANPIDSFFMLEGKEAMWQFIL